MRVEIGYPTLFTEVLKECFPSVRLRQATGFTIDSRLVKSGDVYLAVKGERVDGHDYISDALTAGAALIISEQILGLEVNHLKVDSTLETLKLLAKTWRNKFQIPFIGITGSNGKTSTKELLYHVLSPSFQCMKTPANYNSTIGLPIALFTLEKDSELAIIEMGISKPGEMSTLCEIARPTMSMVTNIYPVHLEFFKTTANVAKEKAGIFSCLPEDGKCFLNIDENHLIRRKADVTTIRYGFSASADFSGTYVSGRSGDILKVNDLEIRLPVPGRAMAQNALAVFTVASTLGISKLEIIQRIETFTVPKGRGEIMEKNGLTIIDDSYNANLASAKSGLDSFKKIHPESRHIAILGDMLELGASAENHHSQLGKYISRLGLNALFTYGELMNFTTAAVSASGIFNRHYQTKEALITDLKSYLEFGDVVYVKGSRGMGMETIIKEGLAA